MKYISIYSRREKWAGSQTNLHIWPDVDHFGGKHVTNLIMINIYFPNTGLGSPGKTYLKVRIPGFKAK